MCSRSASRRLNFAIFVVLLSLTLEDNGDDWSGSHVLDETREERLSLEVRVVLLEVLLRGVDELEVNDLVT